MNYFAVMHRTAAVGLNPVERVARWKEAYLQRISHEIQDLRRSTFPAAAHQAAKWERFKGRFEAARAPEDKK